MGTLPYGEEERKFRQRGLGREIVSKHHACIAQRRRGFEKRGHESGLALRDVDNDDYIYILIVCIC